MSERGTHLGDAAGRDGLSAAGEARRAAMLRQLQGEVSRVRRGRVARRRAGVAAAVVGISGLLWVGVMAGSRGGAGSGAGTPVAGPGGGTKATQESAGETSRVFARGSEAGEPGLGRTVVVGTDAGVMARYALETGRGLRGLRVLSDEELVAELRGMGRECGLVKMEGRAWVTCEPPARGG